jgi:hypothetical protein
MNLLRIMCCFFGGRCAEEEPRRTTDTPREQEPADLGQREAEREKASEDQLGRMEGEGSSTIASGQNVRGRT